MSRNPFKTRFTPRMCRSQDGPRTSTTNALSGLPASTFARTWCAHDADCHSGSWETLNAIRRAKSRVRGFGG